MKRFFAYIRVSDPSQDDERDPGKKEHRDGASFTEQRSVIARYAEREGLTIVEWFREIETASVRGRPIFTAMAKRLRKGEANGFIVHKVDRSSRNYHDWADINDLADEGFDVCFASDNLDLSTRGKRLLADVQAVFATDYIRNLKEEVRKGIHGRLTQGLLPWGAPLGYVNNGHRGKVKTIDPVTGPIVRRAYELYATGAHSLDTLCTELQRMGLRNRQGGRVTRNGVSAMLNNPFYIGLIAHKKGGAVYKGVHDPLIGKQLFDRVQALLSGKTQKKAKNNLFRYRRTFRCAECGYTLVGERQKGHVYYRCHTKSCPLTGVREELLEAAVVGAYARLQLSDAQRIALEAEIAAFLSVSEESTKRVQENWKLQLAALQVRRDRLIDAFLEGTLDKETFEPRKKRLLMEERELEEKLSKDVDAGQIATRLREILELASTALLSHEMGNDDEKRELLEMLTSNRRVDRENVVVELSFPFCLLVEHDETKLCGRTRYASRSHTNLPKRKDPPELGPRHVIEKIFNWLKDNPSDR
ncbi:MAG TPA: recombinase family protein [Thermoanaerobaculia bacterium]|jgi:DNA invertase Pin-like site-specific DNA recombinase|nr:recombinase family protein [Thermoanaerobaculia bacterium]